jgi:hypothetical protein
MYNNGKVLKVENPTIINNVGGSTHVRGIFKVKVKESWHDYETGYNFKGEIISAEDIETARKAGTTGRKPEDYKNLPNKDLYFKTIEAYNNFNPTQIYFSQFDIVEDRKKHSSIYAFTSKLEHYFG